MITGSNLIRFRVSVVGRPAFQDVADVNVFALEGDGFDDLRQKLARAAHEGQTLLIFVVARRFAHKDEFGTGIPGAEHDVGPASGQLTALANADVPEKFELAGQFVRVHFSNCTTRSRILSAMTCLLTSGTSSVLPDLSMIVA